MANVGVWGLGIVTAAFKTPKDSELLRQHGILEIVAVHGLRGNRDEVWRTGWTWLQEHMTTYIANARVSTFGYESIQEGVDGGDIERAAKGLLDGICNGELADTTYPRTFILIGHDIGGLIIKQALLMANDDPIYSVVARDTSLLLFFGSPQRATGQAGWEELARNLIHATGQKNNAPLSDILRQSSFTLKDVNERYTRLAKIYDAVSYYETFRLDDFVGFVVDQYSSTMDLPNETTLARDTHHLDLCRDIKDTDEIFTWMCDRMSTALTFDPQYTDCLHTLSLLSGTTQINPSTLPKTLEPKWILEDKTYLEFISQKSGVLQILGQSGSGLSIIYAFLPPNLAVVKKPHTTSAPPTFSSEEPNILTFSLDSRDYRTCCTSTLFASLLRQLLEGDPRYFRYIRHMYMRVANSDWNLETLWALFRSMISSPYIGQVYCVIDAIDNCDPERNHFLGDFLSLANSASSRFKVIFTNNSGITDTYQSTSTIRVDKRESKQKDLENLVDFEIAELVASKPELEGFSNAIREKILASSPTFLTITLIIKWAQDSQTRSTRSNIEQLLNDMPKTLPQIYEQAYLTNRSSSTGWEFKALFWITHAFRPLKIEELATVLAIESSDEGFRIGETDRPLNLAEDLKRAFGSFLNFQGGEISLVHESARDFLLQRSKDWDPKGKGRQLLGHARISSICLDYILTAQWDELAADAGNSNLESLPSPNGVSSLFSYAAKYWYIHYRVAEKSDQLFEKVRQFLANDERRTLWGHVEWLEGNKLVSKKNTSNWRYIAAQLGLNEVLLSLLDDDPTDDTYVSSIAASRGDLELIKELRKRGMSAADPGNLEFAARNGYLPVVLYLLGDNIPETELQEYLGPALHVAAQNGYVDVFIELLRSKADVRSLVNDMTPLHIAAEFGNIEICRKLIEDSVDVNARNESNSTALHLATLAGQLASMELLLDSEADVDCSDDQGFRPLHHAASSGLVDAVKLLISRKASVNSTSGNGRTALHLAAQEGHSRSIQELLSENAKADVNIVAEDIGSPLNVVASTGNLKIARLIIDAGADLGIVDGKNCTALHLAAKYGRTSLVEILLEYELDIDGVGDDGRTALHFAALNGSFGIVKALIEKKAAVDVVDEIGYTALAVAAKRGDLATIQALIKARANVDPIDTSISALHVAAAAGYVEVMTALLDAGATQDREVGGDIPLHSAVESGRVQAVQILLDAAVDVDAHDTEGDTPLLKAAFLGHFDIVKLLLKQGANSQLVNNFSANFLHRAIKSGNLDVVKLALEEKDLLLRSDSDGFIPLHDAVQLDFTEAVSILLASGSRKNQIEEKTRRDRTALHLAVKSGHLEAVKLLLKAKSGINMIDSKRLTPLGLATKNQHLEVAKLLIEEGADANLADKRGFTPLFWAFHTENRDLVTLIQPKTLDLHQVTKRQDTYLNFAARKGMLDNVNDFIKLGIKINTKNVANRTAVMLAAKARHLDSVKALIAAKADLNVVDTKRKTALYFPIRNGDKEMVDVLLEAGALPEPVGAEWPAVYTAAYCRQVDMVKDFIDRKFDIEKQGSIGTPLHVCYDRPVITSALLTAGTKADTLNNLGISPIEFAIQKKYTETVAVYLASGIDPLKGKNNNGRTPLHHAARCGNLDSVNLIAKMVKDAVSLDVRDNEDLTPLQDAVAAGSIDVTKALLATFKCDLSQKNNSGDGLVAIAADADNIEMIKFLLSKEAEVSPALAPRLLKMAAVQGSSSLATTVLERYRSFVDLSKEDEHGWTSEMFARALGNTEVVDAIKAAKGYDIRFTPDMLSPSEWSEVMKAPLLELNGDKLVVKDTTGEDDVVDIMVIQGNHPIPILDKDFYFEIEVLDKGARKVSEIGVGLASQEMPLNLAPGWATNSWGYHGGDGQKYHDSYWGTDYNNAEMYSTGDIVGCLYDIEKKEISFTKNGKLFGIAFKDVSGRLFPVVGLGLGAQIKANFGKAPYKYRDYKDKENVERRRKTGITRRRTHNLSESAPRTPI